MNKNRSPNTFKQDIPVLPDFGIVYDPLQMEYYNTKSDLFLSDDDIAFHKLRPHSEIPTPLPSPLPEKYFVEWKAPTQPSGNQDA